MSEVRGLVEYPVDEQATQLFPGLSNGMTLYVSGDSTRIWVGTTGAVRKGVGLPMNPLASISWPANKPMYACTEGPGLTATVVGVDIEGSVNDPTLLASLISGGTVDATAIANAIATSGLTSPGIAAAIDARGLNPGNIAAAILATLNPVAIGDEVGLSVPSAANIGAAVGAAVPSAANIANAVAAPAGGTPVLLQLRSLGSSIPGSTPPFSDVWVGGVHDAGGWSVPAGKKLVVQLVTVEAVNTAAATAALARLQLVEDGGSDVYHAVAMRLAGGASRGIVQMIPPGAVVVPTGVDLRVSDMTGAAGVTLDVTVNGTLY